MNKNNKTIFSFLFSNNILIVLLILICVLSAYFFVPEKSKVVKFENTKQSKIGKYLAKTAKQNPVVLINEIMYHPINNNRQEEYLELYNNTNSDISLKEWRIRGIKFSFPKDAVINRNDFLVIAADPDYIQKKYDLPLSKVLGGYSGRLSNSGEILQLLKPDGSVEDEVYFSDGGEWSSDADGKGSSLELINPNLNNNLPWAWDKSCIIDPASKLYGTPGKQNSVYRDDIKASIESITVNPVIPVSSRPVSITCKFWRADYYDDKKTSSTINIFYRFTEPDKTLSSDIQDIKEAIQENSNPDAAKKDESLKTDAKNAHVYSAEFKRIPMCKKISDIEYYAEIPPPSTPDVLVEFYVQAFATDGSLIQKPAEGERSPYVFQVSDSSKTQREETIPIINIALSNKNFKTLFSRDLYDNNLLPATVTADNKTWFDAGIRLRGDSSRQHWKKSYRLEFSENNGYNSRSKVYLNAKTWHSQCLGSHFFTKAGLPAPEVKPVKVYINGNDFQTFALLDSIDQDFLTKWFPGNDSGNLYRAIRGGNLDFRGDDKEKYRENYSKITNKDKDDFTDVIELCRAFSNVSNNNYIENIKKLIDYEEWITYFACNATTANLEGIYYYPEADDYFLYKRPDDGKFVILPWDFDSVLLQPMLDIKPNRSAPNVQRFLNHPDVIKDLYKNTFKLMNSIMNFEQVKAALLPMKKYIEEEKNNPKGCFTTLLRAYKGHESVLKDQLHEKLTAGIITDYSKKIIPEKSAFDYHIGWDAPPEKWNQQDFSKGLFSFYTGFGYNWKNITGYIDFVSNNSIYLRKTFTINSKEDLKNLRLCVDYSGGFIAYLNGKEIIRKFMPETGVTFSTYSTVAKKMANTEVFDLAPFSDNIKIGQNLLAVQAHIFSNDQEFFVIHPWILSGDYVPYKSIINENNKITIGGFFPILDTVKVSVNNEDSVVDLVRGEWRKDISLVNGWNRFSIQAKNKMDDILQTESLELFYSPSAEKIGGKVQNNLQLEKKNSPYLITETLVVEPGSELKIDAGCVLLFSGNAALEVKGKLTAEGTESEPIYFMPIDNLYSWSGVVFNNSKEKNIMNNCIIERAMGYPGVSTGNVGLINSKLNMKNSFIYDFLLTGIDIYHSMAILENCRIQKGYSSYDGDGIQGSGESEFGPSVVENCLIEDLNGDGIDYGLSSMVLRNVLIRNCADKGISIDKNSKLKIENAIISKCNTGLGIKDSKADISAMMIVNSNEGIKFYYPDGKMSQVNLINSLIWNTPNPFVDIKENVLSASYCNIQHRADIKGEGNISVDPVFVNPNSDNYRFFKDSPMNKAGKGGAPLIDSSWLANIKGYNYER